MTMNTEDFFKHPGWGDICRQIKYEIYQAKRPPEQVILDDADLQQILKISKRSAAELRATRQITYSKPCGKIYYKLSDILKFVEKNRTDADF